MLHEDTRPLRFAVQNLHGLRQGKRTLLVAFPKERAVEILRVKTSPIEKLDQPIDQVTGPIYDYRKRSRYSGM